MRLTFLRTKKAIGYYDTSPRERDAPEDIRPLLKKPRASQSDPHCGKTFQQLWRRKYGAKESSG